MNSLIFENGQYKLNTSILLKGEAINFKSYKILLTAITIMEFIFATLISTALDQSTDKPEEVEK